MSPSPVPPESPDRAVDDPVEPGALPRFKQLAARLFGMDQAAFREAAKADEAERARLRALNPHPPGRGRNKD